MPSQAKQRVVRVASGRFADSGICNTSMRDLAGALEIQAPSLYSHFDSKDALVRACLADYVTACRGLSEQEGSLEEVLLAYGKLLDDNRAAARILHYDPAIGSTEAADVVDDVVTALHVMLSKRGVPFALTGPLLAMYREPWRHSTEVSNAVRYMLIKLVISATAQ